MTNTLGIKASPALAATDVTGAGAASNKNEASASQGASGGFGQVFAGVAAKASEGGQTVAAEADPAAAVEEGAQAAEGETSSALVADVPVSTESQMEPALTAWAVGPQLRVITDGSLGVSPEALTAFAKEQGLDEAAAAALGVGQLGAEALAKGALAASGPGAQTGDTAALAAWAARGLTQVVSSESREVANAAAAAAAAPTAAQLAAAQGLSASALSQLVSSQSKGATLAPGVGPASGAGASADAPDSPVALMAALMGAGLGEKASSATPASGVQEVFKGLLGNAPQPGWSAKWVSDTSPLAVGAGTVAVTSAAVLQAGSGVQALMVPGARTEFTMAALAAGNAQTWEQDLALDGVTNDDVASLLDMVGADVAASPADEGASVTTATGTSLSPASGTVAAKEPALTGAQAFWRQHANFEDVSQKMGEALAQRIQAQIQRGHWNMTLTLHPSDLGQVNVSLGMRGQDLQASFQVAQQLTRDLVQDSLPRLKELLGQAGIDVAFTDVGGQASRERGGNSTPMSSPRGEDAAPAQLPPAGSTASVAKKATDGLDLWA